MKRMDLLSELVVENQTKMVLLVIDGLGGLPGEDGKTELEAALTPNFDKLATKSETGLLQMVDPGITPGSGPGHLALFGYDPLDFRIGRGILEALGVGAQVESQDVCVRGNFATLSPDDVVLDRRAGRISTEKNKELISFLSENIKEIRGVQVRLYP
ncbi:MAG: phosphoglycerate mutase, partial [Acetomicrobium sp.]